MSEKPIIEKINTLSFCPDVTSGDLPSWNKITSHKT